MFYAAQLTVVFYALLLLRQFLARFVFFARVGQRRRFGLVDGDVSCRGRGADVAEPHHLWQRARSRHGHGPRIAAW